MLPINRPLILMAVILWLCIAATKATAIEVMDEQAVEDIPQVPPQDTPPYVSEATPDVTVSTLGSTGFSIPPSLFFLPQYGLPHLTPSRSPVNMGNSNTLGGGGGTGMAGNPSLGVNTNFQQPEGNARNPGFWSPASGAGNGHVVNGVEGSQLQRNMVHPYLRSPLRLDGNGGLSSGGVNNPGNSSGQPLLFTNSPPPSQLPSHTASSSPAPLGSPYYYHNGIWPAGTGKYLGYSDGMASSDSLGFLPSDSIGQNGSGGSDSMGQGFAHQHSGGGGAGNSIASLAGQTYNNNNNNNLIHQYHLQQLLEQNLFQQMLLLQHHFGLHPSN